MGCQERVVPDPRWIRASYSGGAASASDRTSGGPLASARHGSARVEKGQPRMAVPQRTTAVIWIPTPSGPTSGSPATVAGTPPGQIRIGIWHMIVRGPLNPRGGKIIHDRFV